MRKDSSQQRSMDSFRRLFLCWSAFLLKELVHFLNGILDFVLVFEVLRALTTLRFQGKEKRGGD